MNPAIQGEQHHKRRYQRVEYDGAWFISSPADVRAFLMDASAYEPQGRYTVTDVWLSPAEFDALPEFTGF